MTSKTNRFQVAFNLLRALVGFHKGYFVIAVSGAAVFATATVVSSYGVKLVIDNVILPAFSPQGVAFTTWGLTSVAVVAIALIRFRCHEAG